MRIVGVALVLAGLGCGAASPPPPVGGPPDLTARPQGADDPIVARVDGRPIYGSCVAAQAAGRKVDARTALDDCIQLELLAGAAIARGLDRDPAIAAAGHDAAAARLVDREFRDRYQRFADLPASVRDPIMADNSEARGGHPLRASYFARVAVAKADAGGPREALAVRAIQDAHAAIAPRADLFPDDLKTAVQRAAAAVDPTLEIQAAPASPTREDFGLVEPYRKALFAVPQVGMVSSPTRTAWGWDLILYVEGRSPPALSLEQLGAKLFPRARLQYWNVWSGELARAHRAQVIGEGPLRRRLGDARTQGPSR